MSLKNALLEALLGSQDEDLSGSALAARLGVSRAAVWKAVDQLREEGYAIEAGTNRGYRLLSDNDRLSEPAIRRLRQGRTLGEIIRIYPALSSTNDTAKELAANGAAAGTVVIADSQSAGKGRRGRTFFSPPGSGLYLSVILRPRLTGERAALITSLAAAAAAKAVEQAASMPEGTVGIQMGQRSVHRKPQALRYPHRGVSRSRKRPARLRGPWHRRQHRAAYHSRRNCGTSPLRYRTNLAGRFPAAPWPPPCSTSWRGNFPASRPLPLIRSSKRTAAGRS